MIAINDKSRCCGCGACSQRCPHGSITLGEDEQGFLYPKVNPETCVDCHLCEQVCPCLNEGVTRGTLHAFAAVNPDETERMASSSGGIFSLLARDVISRGGMVFGARFDDQWNVLHDCAETMEDLSRFRGSKYVQSVIGDSYRRVENCLKQGREVLFSGTPCQIAGLRLFLRKDYDRLLMLEVACHGVPSPKLWQEYLHLMAGENHISEVNFRNKSTGWRDYSVQIGENTRRHDDDEFIGCFLGDYSLRPSCFNCRFKAGQSGADITLADFWGIGAIAPHLDDDRGTSLIVVNSAKGMTCLNRCGVKCEEIDYPRALKANPSLEHSSSKPADYDAFWRQFVEKNPRRVILKYGRRHRPGLVIRLKRFIASILRK